MFVVKTHRPQWGVQSVSSTDLFINPTGLLGGTNSVSLVTGQVTLALRSSACQLETMILKSFITPHNIRESSGSFLDLQMFMSWTKCWAQDIY